MSLRGLTRPSQRTRQPEVVAPPLTWMILGALIVGPWLCGLGCVAGHLWW